MLLTGATIAAEQALGRLNIDPFSQDQCGPVSYVMRLGRRFRRWHQRGAGAVRLWSAAAAHDWLEEPWEAGAVLLRPGEFLLACTAEQIGLPEDLWGQLSPLSHVARFGLGIHCGADLINPGFGAGRTTPLTLELFNHNSVSLELTAGMPVAHLRLCRADAADSASMHKSIYEGRDPLGQPMLFEEWASRLERMDG